MGGGGRCPRMPGVSGRSEAANTPPRKIPERAGLEKGTFPKGAWSLSPSTASGL